MSYLIPAPYTGMSTWRAHTRRTPPSSEPGTDYYMPIGTPLRAPTRCRVVDVGGSVVPATGRFVTVDDGTRWLRFLHLAEWRSREGDWLDPGEVFGLSGASGYGSEYFGASSMAQFPWARTGGPHVHVTAFRGRGYTFGSSGTVDFHAMTGGVVAGGSTSEENDMTPEQDARLRNIENLLAGGGPSLSDPSWTAAQGTVLQHLQNLTGFVWAGGTSAADPEYLGAPGTVYNLLKAPVQRTIDGETVAISQIQDNADTNTMVRQLIDRPVDAAALAKALAPALADHLGALSDDDVHRLAVAAADEEDRRNRERLAG